MFNKMKKMTFLACAAMLTSALVFTGCNNEEKDMKKVPTVTTDITISLPGQVGNNGMRRMPGATVQTSGYTDFSTNGMKGIILVPFGPSAVVTTSSVRLGDNIGLGTIGTTQAYTASADGRAKVFTGKQVPTGTSAFLFYGESGASGSDNAIGYLGANLEGEPSAFTFSLKPINLNSATVTGNAAYTGMIAYLNHVANATDGTKVWKNYTASDNEGLYQMFVEYAKATALSSYNIRRMMEDLYKSLMSNTSDPMAKAIKDSIATAEYATVNTTTGEVTLVSALQGFPESLGLPQGSIAVAYDGVTNHAFDGNAAHAYGGLAPSQINIYAYPPSLWYYANTKIKTSTTSKEAAYTGAKSWAEILGKYEKDNGSVNATTRSIALKDTVQYAVGRLDVLVRYKDGETWLEDNDPVAAKNKVTKPSGGFPLSAVLVGGQKNVGFDFTQATYAGTVDSIYTLYDNSMTSTIAASSTTYSEANSTLVLETPDGTDEFIAVEFTNNTDKDFYGVDGIVPIGAKFYMVAKLEPATRTVNNTGTQVFKQDYTTIAKLSIKDLKSAYIIIPDLRAPQLEIGLSVDLSWQAGNTYEVDL